MRNLNKRIKAYTIWLWALLLSASLVLGACGEGSNEARQPSGGEIVSTAERQPASESGASETQPAAQNGTNETQSETQRGESNLQSEPVSGTVDTAPATGEETGEAGTESGTEKGESAAQSGESNQQSEPVSGTADTAPETGEAETGEAETEATVEPGGSYSDAEHVALYLHLYGELPSNYLTKSEARDLGWDSGKGNLWDVAPGMSIGGDYFGNREGLLPKKKGRSYYECDINYSGGYRGGERIVYSDDGLVYYSADHYENFELLYDEEGKAE